MSEDATKDASEEAGAATPASSAPEKESKRLTPAQWTEICTRYEYGHASAAQLSREFGVSGTALHAYFRRHNIKGNSKKEEVSAAVASAIKESIVPPESFAAKRRGRIEEAKEQALEDLNLVRRWTRNVVAEAITGKRKPATIGHDLKALRLASAIFAENRQERYAVLDVNSNLDENELPTLQIEDLSDEEIIQLQQKTDDDEAEVEDLAELFGEEDEKNGDGDDA